MTDACLKETILPLELNDVNFTGVDFKGRDFTNYQLKQCNLTETDCSHVNFTNANLTGSILNDSNLNNVNLTNTIIPTKLSGVNLSNVDLQGRDLTDCDLIDANLSNTNLTNVRLPNKLVGVNFTGVDLGDRDFTGYDISGSSLQQHSPQYLGDRAVLCPNISNSYHICSAYCKIRYGSSLQQPPQYATPLHSTPNQQINSLEQCVNALVSLDLKDAEGKKVLDVKQRITGLAYKLSSNELSSRVISELSQLTTCVATQDYTNAQRHYLNLVKFHWTNNNQWILGLKTLLLMAKKYLGGQ
jgi:hypothetical protein